MKVIHGSCSEDFEETEYKTCPICGATCFIDMETCFGCLHHFDERPPSRAELQEAIDRVSAHDGSSITDEDLPDRREPPTRQPSPTPQESSEHDMSCVLAQNEERPETPTERSFPASFDHTQDIARLKKPSCTPAAVNEGETNFRQEDDDLVSRHICADKEGRQFEIAISVRLL